jgi:protoheme IX farnesyltransferase
VTGRVAWTPLVLFVLIFVWTPPHFWALAVKYQDDYRAAGVPMLPAVTTAALTARWILCYSLVMVGVSLVFAVVAGMGLIYSGSALVLGAGFVVLSVQLYRDPSLAASMRLFGYSITYLTLLFVAIAVDQLVRIG